MAQSPRVLERRGGVSDQEFTRVRNAGFANAEIAAIIADVALNVLTKDFKRAAETEIHFATVTGNTGGPVRRREDCTNQR